MTPSESLRQIPLTDKDMKRMIPAIRKTDIPLLTSTLDTEIACTLCGGSKLAIVQNAEPITGGRWQDCPNCFDPKIGKSTGKMQSRTKYEQWEIDRQRRRP